ncbi:hypothetical protein M8J76_006369 [Diaphorina citri]|nr:hypothetical protein M8J75_009401 [Diaphorina citri]KAI5729764.1 hypothetical protein M8J76_006369 [Diaphorina citri]KAI5734403.1 hypothetical protein M8J77_006069 [Diaphorina citri]
MKKNSPGVSTGSFSKPPRGRKFRNTLAECTESLTESPECLQRMANTTGLEDLVAAMRMHNSSKEVLLSLTGWVAYLKALKGLISSGSQLTFYLSSLSHCRNPKAAQLQGVWEQLMMATNEACQAVKKHISCTLQDVDTSPDIDVDQLDINQQAMCNSLSTLIHLQLQFSSACCECLKHLTPCPCDPPHPPPSEISALIRSYAPPPPRIKSPNFAPPQRRWSEAAPVSGGGAQDPTLRRWSMPWKLSMPLLPPHRSSPGTPDTGWSNALIHQDDLSEVINLMSVNPTQSTQQLHYPMQNLPGVVLTRAESQDISSYSAGMSPRGSWWSEAEGDDLTHLSDFLTSRKSSSSTDTSSSCYSLHSRSASSSEESGVRAQFYSVCSGSDLPFVKLPETKEPPDDQDDT